MNPFEDPKFRDALLPGPELTAAVAAHRAPPAVLDSPRDRIMRDVLALPRSGTPAADLTERERVAVAFAAGVPCEVVTSAERGSVSLTIRTIGPVGIADRGDGGYIVAVGKAST